MEVRVKRLYSLAQFNNIEVELKETLEGDAEGNVDILCLITKLQKTCDLSFYNYVEQQKRLKESANAKQLLEEELGE